MISPAKLKCATAVAVVAIPRNAVRNGWFQSDPRSHCLPRHHLQNECRELRVTRKRCFSVEPLAWLTDVLERIVSGRTKAAEIGKLLPWNWKADRAATEIIQAAA